MCSQHSYTSKDGEIVRAMAADGHSLTEIGIAIKRSRGSVSGFVQRNGIQMKGKLAVKRNGTKLKPKPRIRKQSTISIRTGHVVKKNVTYSVEQKAVGGVAMFARRNDQCAAIMGEPRDMICCGNPVFNKTYCKDCHKAFYQTVSAPRVYPVIEIPVVIAL